MGSFGEILKRINEILWGDFYIFLIIAACLYLSVKSGFVQVKLFDLIKEFASAVSDKKKRSAVSTALAASMGTGNIIGTAAAIGAGGEGAVFWMIVTSLFGMSAAYAENYLGMYYRKRGKNSVPMDYIKDIPAGKVLSVIYAVSCVLAAFFMGNMIQGNAACSAAASFFKIDIRIPAVLFALIVGMIVSGGGERIKSFAGKVIPVISAMYLIFCITGLILNSDRAGESLRKIISSAFSFKAVSGGVFGMAVSVGLRRGIFSNEAGMGSSVLVHAQAGSKDPAETGKWAAFEVFFDTAVCCTLTALLIISSGSSYDESGAYEAFCVTFGKAGEIFIAFSLMLFALSSMLGWCCYGETALQSICGKKYVTSAYRFFHVIFLYIGGVTQMKFLWQFADICDFIMLTINMAAVIIGVSQIKKIT